MLKRLAGGLIVFVCFCLLVSLGLWQVQRLQWKEDLLARLADGMENPAAAWSDGDRLPEFSHVVLSGGKLLPNPALKVYGRTVDGVAGAHIVVLYRASTGRSIIVDRGFLPTPVDQARVDVSTTAPVDGIVRAPSDKAWFEMKNNPALNEWYWMDLPAMGRALGDDDVAPLYVEALAPTGGETGPLPTGDRLASNLSNNHLQYAITWFTLATVLAVGYAIWLMRSLKDAARLRQQKVDQMYKAYRNPHPHYHDAPRQEVGKKHDRV